MHKLLTSAAYANTNSGVQTRARYMGTPNPEPLVGAAKAAEQGGRLSDDILSKGKDIAEMHDYWDMTDAIVEGYKAVRRCGETYLPKFADEDNATYDVRLGLTKMTNVYRDIVEALASKPFEGETGLAHTEENAEKKPPQEFLDFVEDVDGEGNNLTKFLGLTFFNGINSAIDWILIDYPTVDRESIRTKADQKQANIKPYWSHVLARNVLMVKTTKIGSKQELTYVKIFEPGINEKDRVRIFTRVGDVVTWELWEQSDVAVSGKSQYVQIGFGQLSIKVIPMVPFTTGRRDGSSWKFFPPMQDAADLQIQLYQDESALKYIRTLAGYPMLAANGMKPQLDADGKTPKKVAIGPGRVLWGVPDGNGNHGEWKYVEPSANTLEMLAKDIETEKNDLRELGRQPLTAQSGNLTVITSAVAAGKAGSAVQAWALGLKDAAENALVITGLFMGNTTYEPEVNVFTEFDNFMDGGADLDTLTKARAARDISRETYWSELKRRKVLAPEFDGDDENDRLLKEIPADGIDDEAEDDNNGKPPTKKPGVKDPKASKKPAV